jgi:prepilin-type N-terminal cleavage/methylation domain-containing protein
MSKASKFQISNSKYQKGFTVIELLVVISIMGIMVGLLLINFGNERSARNLRIAQNELVSNIRKAQGYALSSRSLNGGMPAQFYILKFDASSLAESTEYEIQAVYDYFTATPKLEIIETVKLPGGVRIGPVTGNQSTTGLYLERPIAPTSQYPTCALIAFRLPFANVITSGSCTFANFSSNSIDNDAYRKIVDFIANSSAEGEVSLDSNLTIRLIDDAGGQPRAVEIRGVSGKVTAQ